MRMSLIRVGDGSGDRDALVRVRGWARELWRLSDEDSLLVTELACSEPGCPPRETVFVIAPAGRPTVQRKLHRPVADVTREELEALVSQEPSA